VETAPDLCWLPIRIAADSHLSKRLITLLDREKGISPSPFAEIASEAKTGGPRAVEGEEKELVAAEGTGTKEGAVEGVDGEVAEEEEEGRDEGKDGKLTEEEGKAEEKVNGDAVKAEAAIKEEKAVGEINFPLPASLCSPPEHRVGLDEGCDVLGLVGVDPLGEGGGVSLGSASLVGHENSFRSGLLQGRRAGLQIRRVLEGVI
jgi:hypothetical protein